MYETYKDKLNKKTTSKSDYIKIANEVMFMQMSAKADFKKFGELVAAAIIK